MIHPVRIAPAGPDAALEAIIARHGARVVLIAALRAALRRPQTRPPPPNADDLSAHLRRDVGLPPEAAHSRHAALPPLPLRI